MVIDPNMLMKRNCAGKTFILRNSEVSVLVAPTDMLGAYGSIFVSLDKKFIYKIFRHREGVMEHFIRENTFKSEVLAYKKISEDSELSRYAPVFYGAYVMDLLTEDGGQVVGCKDCLVYCVENINGIFEKVSLSQEAKTKILRFKDAGVNYLEDADYCVVEGQYKFIDFGVLGVREALENMNPYFTQQQKINLFREHNGDLVTFAI